MTPQAAANIATVAAELAPVFEAVVAQAQAFRDTRAQTPAERAPAPRVLYA